MDLVIGLFRFLLVLSCSDVRTMISYGRKEGTKKGSGQLCHSDEKKTNVILISTRRTVKSKGANMSNKSQSS